MATPRRAPTPFCGRDARAPSPLFPRNAILRAGRPRSQPVLPRANADLFPPPFPLSPSPRHSRFLPPPTVIPAKAGIRKPREQPRAPRSRNPLRPPAPFA